jgi:epoxyqueuosine reductase
MFAKPFALEPFSVLHNEPAFKPNNELLNLSSSDWNDITEDVFQRVFQKSPVKAY